MRIGINPTTQYAVSEGQRFAGDTTLIVVNCTSCAVTYAIPESFDRSARHYRGDTANGWKICCPFGHTWWYVGETETQRLKRDLKDERARSGRIAAEKEQVKASLSATKGVVTKQRKKLEKVVAGVCPVDGCKRHFRDLRRHISTKHPGYEGGA